MSSFALTLVVLANGTLNVSNSVASLIALLVTFVGVGALCTGPLATSALVVNWYASHRGRALGIAAAGTSESEQRWDTRRLSELIDFILRQYHEPLRLDLPGLIAAAERVERVHASKASCPRGLAAELKRSSTLGASAGHAVFRANSKIGLRSTFRTRESRTTVAKECGSRRSNSKKNGVSPKILRAPRFSLPVRSR